jgi:hypothetical protein
MSQPWRELGSHFVTLKFPQLLHCWKTESSGLLGEVTRVLREAGTSRALAVFSLALVACAANTQKVINFPSRSTVALGHIALDYVLAGGLIHSILSQCGWTC